MKPLAAVDFEFKHPSNPDMGLISCCISTPEHGVRRFWLWDPIRTGYSDREKLKLFLKSIRQTHTLVAYAIQLAEARCLAALGLDPCQWEWVDLMINWRWLRNSDDHYTYGRIVKNGFAKFTVPPAVRVRKKASQEEIDEADVQNSEWLATVQAESGDVVVGMDQAGQSMLDALYFFECITIEQYREMEAVKAATREGLIMSAPDNEIHLHKEQILEYNASDIGFLPDLAAKITQAMVEVGQTQHALVTNEGVNYMTLDSRDVALIQTSQGAWCARMAKYAHRGIPVSPERLKRLLAIVPDLNRETISSWNTDNPLDPLYRVGFSDRILALKKTGLKQSPYIGHELSADSSYLMQIIERFCVENRIDNWPRTKTGQYDTSKKVISRYAAGDNVLKQYERHKNMLSTLKAFSEVKGKVEALDYIGEDHRQRPNFNPFGTQTARCGHKTKSLIPANAHVFRFLIEPPKGRAIVALDYGMEEVFIAAVLGRDEAMKKAYLTQDYYLAYAQYVGMYPADLPIPDEAQRDEEWFQPYKRIRTIAKTLCLSMSYGAGAKSIAAAVRDATRDESIDDAQGFEWIDEYRNTFSSYTEFTDRIRSEYKDNKIPQLLCNGWRLGTDNPSPLSAGNFPVQGTGSVILMRACEALDEAGIEVIFSMHDEIAFECADAEAEALAEKAKKIMIEAATTVLQEPGMKVGAPEIIRHGDWWMHSDRAVKGWERFKKYFNRPDDKQMS